MTTIYFVSTIPTSALLLEVSTLVSGLKFYLEITKINYYISLKVLEYQVYHTKYCRAKVIYFLNL